MGTSYPIFEKDGIELVLNEHSNKFDFTTYMKGGRAFLEVSLNDMTVDELGNTIAELTKVFSYWCTEDQRSVLASKIRELL